MKSFFLLTVAFASLMFTSSSSVGTLQAATLLSPECDGEECSVNIDDLPLVLETKSSDDKQVLKMLSAMISSEIKKDPNFDVAAWSRVVIEKAEAEARALQDVKVADNAAPWMKSLLEKAKLLWAQFVAWVKKAVANIKSWFSSSKSKSPIEPNSAETNVVVKPEDVAEATPGLLRVVAEKVENVAASTPKVAEDSTKE